MFLSFIRFSVTGFILLLGFSFSLLASDTTQAKVVRIMDGDTFEVLLFNKQTEKIRLHGIDCPERNQPFSNVAKSKLSDLIFSRTVNFVRMDTDRYGRTIAMVFVDSVNVNEALLRAGLAWHFKRYDRNPAWDALEKQASTLRLGLWADERPIAPWEWRKVSPIPK